jgi:hypothetical protein
MGVLDGDGRIMGPDAIKFFGMSKLSSPDLKKVLDSHYCGFTRATSPPHPTTLFPPPAPPSAMDRGHCAPPLPVRPRCWPLRRPPPRATSPLHLLMPPLAPWIEAVMRLRVQRMSKGRGIVNRRLPPNTNPLGTLHSFSSSFSKAPIFWPTNSDIMEG